MKNLRATAVAASPLLTTSAAFAQNGNMMNGGSWGGGWMGGYGGIGMSILLVVVIALVVWIVTQKNK